MPLTEQVQSLRQRVVDQEHEIAELRERMLAQEKEVGGERGISAALNEVKAAIATSEQRCKDAITTSEKRCKEAITEVEGEVKTGLSRVFRVGWAVLLLLIAGLITFAFTLLSQTGAPT